RTRTLPDRAAEAANAAIRRFETAGTSERGAGTGRTIARVLQCAASDAFAAEGPSGHGACSSRRSVPGHGASQANRGPAHGIAVDREADAGCLGAHFGIERFEGRNPNHLTG